MPNGMGPDPTTVQAFKQLSTTKDGRTTSIHVIPVEQFAHNVSSSGECLCGPDTDYITLDEGVQVQVTHYALDARYWDWAHYDWGPDGPDW